MDSNLHTPHRGSPATFFSRMTATSDNPKLIEKRFLAKIREKSQTGCWLWIGACIPNGYGFVTIDHKNYPAHHVSWMLYRGPLPKDPYIFVLHICDVRNCVNPDHLFLGTQLENLVDASQKGRISRTHQVSGENASNAKLTMVDVLEIRKAEGLVSQQNLAADYGVSESTIWRVLHRRTYTEDLYATKTVGKRTKPTE